MPDGKVLVIAAVGAMLLIGAVRVGKGVVKVTKPVVKEAAHLTVKATKAVVNHQK